MANAWRFEKYDREGKLSLKKENQPFRQVWMAASDCWGAEAIKFAAPADAAASELAALGLLGAVRID